MGIDDYMYGVHDFDIALDFLEENFFKEDAAPLLDKLVFNRDIQRELKDYIEVSKTKVDSEQIDKAFTERFKTLTKEYGFKKMPAADHVGKVSLKESYFKKRNGFTIYIIARRGLGNFPLAYEFSVDWDEKIEWVERNTKHDSYGVPFISFIPNRYCQLKHPSAEGIYLQSDLDLALSEFDKDLSVLREILVSLENQRPEEIFKVERYYNHFFGKLKDNVRVLKRISNTEEVHFCILYYFFSDQKKKGKELLDLFDKIPENENQMFRKIVSGAVADLLSNAEARGSTGFFNKILKAVGLRKT